ALQIHHRPASLPRRAAASVALGHDEPKVPAWPRLRLQLPDGRGGQLVHVGVEPHVTGICTPRIHHGTFWSGGTSRYCKSKPAICANAGAATMPPKIAPCGSSTLTSTRRLGLLAGTMPTNVATYLPGS